MTLTCESGHAEACCDLRASCVGHQVQECVAALGPVRNDVSWAPVARTHSIDNCVILGEHFRGVNSGFKAFGVLSDASKSSGYRPGQAW